MKERPILMSAPMVRAVLAGTKTQTRRPVKGTALEWLEPDAFAATFVALPENHLCPYGYAGDRLWVREGFAPLTKGWAYRADPIWNGPPGPRWYPSIHMPREACRLRLEVTGVRIERLQDISEEDAQAEGCEPAVEATMDDERLKIECGYYPPSSYAHGYRLLWDSINGTGSWEANPWVWVVEFRRVEPC